MKYTPYLLIAALIAVVMLQRGCYRSQMSQQTSKYNLLVANNNSLISEVNKKGELVKKQVAAPVSDHKQLNAYADSLFALKRKLANTIAFYKNHVQTRIDTFEIAFTKTDTLPVFITDSFARNNMVVVPKYFATDSPYYSIQGAVRKEGVNIYDITIQDTLTGRFVEGRKKLFRPRPIEYQVMNTNPYVNITGSSSAAYKPKRKGPMGHILVGLLGFAAGVFFTR